MMKTYNSQFTDEFYTVEDVVEAVVIVNGQTVTVRIEALEGPPGTFTTRAYQFRTVSLSPDESDQIKLWVAYDLPKTHRQSPADAIDQALSFLAETVRPSNFG